MDLLNHILFINLDHRKDRLKQITTEFNNLGIDESKYERFPGVKAANGAIGCTLSHIKCIELAKSREYPYVFICEDDITCINPNLFKTNLTKFANSNINWDVVIISGNNCPPYIPVSDYCIKIQNCQTTAGYIVAQHYYDVLIGNFKEGLEKLLREPENKRLYAIDMYWKQLQQIHNWYLIIPLTVTQNAGYSDIEQCYTNYKNTILDLDKSRLFHI